LQNSILYGHFTKSHAVKFELFQPIQNKLTFQDHENKSIDIKYMQAHNFSKRSRDSKAKDDKTAMDFYESDINNFMGDDPFIRVVNNDIVNTTSLKGTAISVCNHGINDYRHYNKVVFAAALNRTPIHNRMLLAATCLDQSFITRASVNENAYQSIMRCSLRDSNSTETVTIVVIDKQNADSLATFFPKCDVTIGTLFSEGYKVKKVNTFDRHQYATQYAANQKLKSNKIINGLKHMDTSSNFFISTIGTKFESKVEYLELDSRIEMRKQLKHNWMHTIIENKNQEMLYNVTQYLNDWRGLVNVERCCALIFDIDDGDMTVEIFEQIIQEMGLSALTFNSYSTGIKQSFRSIVFVQRSMTADEYKACHKFLRDKIEKLGYVHCKDAKDRAKILQKNPNTKFSGIDNSKLHAESFYYLPCKVKGREQHAFFHSFHCKDEADIQRHSLDVDAIMALQVEKTEISTVVLDKPSNVTPKQVTAEQICDKLSWAKGDYHNSSVKAGSRGASLGVDLHDMQQEVRSRVPDNFKHHERNVKWGYSK